MNVITAITIEMHRKSVDQKHLVQQSDILRSLCCSPCHLWRGSYRQVKINNHQNTTRTIDYDSYQKLIACEAAMQYLREKVRLSKNMYLRYMEPFLFLNYVVVCCGFTREKCNFPNFRPLRGARLPQDHLLRCLKLRFHRTDGRCT